MMSIIEHLPAILIVLPLFASTFIAMTARYEFFAKCQYAVTVLVFLALSLLLLNRVLQVGSFFYSVGGWFSSVGIVLIVNIQSSLMLIITSIGFLISLPSFLYRNVLSINAGVFACLMLSGLCGLCLSADFFNTYVFLELTSIASYVFLMYGNKTRIAYKVAFDYLIVGSFAGIFVLIGILFIYVATGSLSMITLSSQASSFVAMSPENILLIKIGYAIIVSGFAIKCGLYPLYTWLTKTYSSGPSAVIALLASTVSKIYVFLIYKVSMIFYDSSVTSSAVMAVGNMLSAVALIGMVVIGFVITGEKNFKKELSLSSMIQVCYFTVGIFTFSSVVMSGTMLQMLSHTICIGVIFIMLESGYYSISDRYQALSLRELPKILISRRVIIRFTFIVLILSIAGYPFTAGFIAKWLLTDGVLDQNWSYCRFIFVVVSNVIGMLYTWRLIERLILFSWKSEENVHTVRVTRQRLIVRIIACFGLAFSLSIGFLAVKGPFVAIRTSTISYFVNNR